MSAQVIENILHALLACVSRQETLYLAASQRSCGVGEHLEYRTCEAWDER